ncbi:hypothetical protein AHAS_Ahas16G0182300 [Arachis hypogaea]
MEFNSSHDQTNSMGYHPPSPISNDGWEYHQETSNSGLSNSWSHASEPQDEKEKHMGYFPPPQNDSSHYFNGGWEYYQYPNLTGKCTGSHQVIITHRSEVDPTGIDGSSNFSG